MPSKASPLQAVVECGKQFYERRWMWGTAGNLSMRLKSDPLEFAITPSGLNKGHLRVTDLLRLKENQAASHPRGLKPSAETLIHQAVYKAVPDAQVVFHAHPMYAALLSSVYGDPQALRFLPVAWMEMMKIYSVPEGETAQLPIFPNWQDVSLIARDFTEYVKKNGGRVLPILMIYNHGVTVWGSTADQARNHLEVLEYVCEYLYLKRLMGTL
jgi:methylthioribulose-1-phosphate dehydratase